MKSIELTLDAVEYLGWAVSPSARWVYIVLRTMEIGEYEEVTTFVANIAVRCGIDDRQCRRLLRELESARAITTESTPGGASTYGTIPYPDGAKHPTKHWDDRIYSIPCRNGARINQHRAWWLAYRVSTMIFDARMRDWLGENTSSHAGTMYYLMRERERLNQNQHVQINTLASELGTSEMACAKVMFELDRSGAVFQAESGWRTISAEFLVEHQDNTLRVDDFLRRSRNKRISATTQVEGRR